MICERLLPGSPTWHLWGHQHLQRYQFARPWVGGRRVLDLACGVGYGTYCLQQFGAISVTGIDLDANSVDYARRSYARPGLDYFAADALTSDPSDGRPVATVVSFETIEHLPDPPAFVTRLAQHLEPAGTLLISAPNALQFSRAAVPIRNPFHLNEPDYATLCGWLAPHFDILSEWEQSTVGADDTPHADLEARIRTIERHSGLRLWRAAADTVRKLLGRPLPAIGTPPGPSSKLVAFTDIWPLLPERRGQADVFVFVCRKRP